MDSKTDSARGGSSSPEAVRVRDSLRTEFDKINRSDKTGYEKSEAKNIYIAILESEGLDPPVLFNLLTNLGLEYTKGLEDKIEALSHDHKPQGGASVSGGGGGGNPLHFQSAGGAEETSSVKTAATGSVTTVTKSDVKIGNTVLKMVSKDIVRSDSQVKVNGTNPKQEGGGGLEKAFREAPVFGPLYVSSAKSANAAGLVLQPGKIYRHDVSNAGTPTKCILNALAPRATEYGPTGFRSGTWQDKLAETYENIMDSANTTGFSTLEIPQIGTGFYGCDPKESAKIAVKTVKEWLRQNLDTKITEVRFNFNLPGNRNPDNHYVAAFNEVLFTI